MTQTVELESPTNTVASVGAQSIQNRLNPLGLVTDLSSETKQVAGITGVRITEMNEGLGGQLDYWRVML